VQAHLQFHYALEFVFYKHLFDKLYACYPHVTEWHHFSLGEQSIGAFSFFYFYQARLDFILWPTNHIRQDLKD